MKRRSGRVAALRHKYLILHILQQNQSRSVPAVAEVAVDCFPEVVAELVQGASLRVCAKTDRADRLATVQLVFACFQYELRSELLLTRFTVRPKQ